jgi:fatty acid desaturase
MAYNCLACPDNAITFNDGYHIEHHLNPRTHWSELPSRYLANVSEHAKHEGGVAPCMLRPVHAC